MRAACAAVVSPAGVARAMIAAAALACGSFACLGDTRADDTAGPAPGSWRERVVAVLQSPAPDEPSLLLAAGVFALVESYDYPYSVGAQFNARPRTRWRLAPGVGGAFGPDGIAFVYLDVRRDFGLAGQWYFTPSLAGGYFANGDEIGPRDHLEFQTGIMFSRAFDNGLRVGIAGLHISNGGLSHPNNGTESVVLTLRVPL